jgi:hypothetical protein
VEVLALSEGRCASLDSETLANPAFVRLFDSEQPLYRVGSWLSIDDRVTSRTEKHQVRDPVSIPSGHRVLAARSRLDALSNDVSDLADECLRVALGRVLHKVAATLRERAFRSGSDPDESFRSFTYRHHLPHSAESADPSIARAYR